MAKAERAIHEWQPYVTLTLSAKEAQALYDVASSVGGKAETRRRYFSDTPESLREVLAPYVSLAMPKDKTGAIWFS